MPDKSPQLGVGRSEGLHQGTAIRKGTVLRKLSAPKPSQELALLLVALAEIRCDHL